jgi:hypothetical protein
MSEKIISQQAKDMYDEHKKAVNDQYSAEFFMHGIARNLIQAKIDDMNGTKRNYNKGYLEADIVGKQRKAELAAGAVDAQANASKQFVSEHLDKFIDHAVNVAASEGVQINVQEPESITQPVEVHTV